MIGIGTVLKKQAFAIATAVLVAQAAVYYSGSAKEVVPTVAPWSQFPTEVGPWKADANQALGQEVLNALQPDDYLARYYVESPDQPPVSLFIGYFNSRRDGRAPHSPQWCLPGAGWKSLSATTISIPIPHESQPLPSNEYIIEKGQSKSLVYYWYHQGNRPIASEVISQLYSLPDLLFHGRTDTALVRIIVPVEDNNMARARAAGTRFAQAVYPLIRKHIT